MDVQTGWLIRAEQTAKEAHLVLSQLACVVPRRYSFPRFSRLLIVLVDYWTSKLRYQILGRKGEGKKGKRKEKNSIQLQNLLHDFASKRLKDFFKSEWRMYLIGDVGEN